ncbi:hypothetical protein D9757_000277 [Collybiopsis confluens]|uniref:GAR domain-containing protein n=1 Tax=Collybiopsis confluens TaxID=2823264 RepID=A0A8H5MH48_9AGAR|nr:hypothetical protein D9757_000277 [Collybiopsis confluens]
MSEDPPSSHTDASSGTVVAPSYRSNLPNPSSEDLTNVRTEGDEEALESHQVIELQSFIERKTWIEEKIKLLEKMPPIQVFVGLDAVQTSAEEIPGLPTRSELKQWLVEHDIVEKETEIFDTGELKKLRKFTRAATQRNLSPEDTDLIELTLTTIYALDKLLHLLRDRSENLDLLGVRLSWEENRIASWVDRRRIISDLQSFLHSRAQWSASAYDLPLPAEDHRRGSIGSISSVSSDTSISSLALSRITRFKLAELLSRDAAAFSARVSSLRHGTVAATGKFLDKLIDHSRKPVPEVLLDEQDKLEEKCVSEMESIGNFVLNVVMQWRKADEVYVETKKDYFGAQTLSEEIEIAMAQHPMARQSSAFTTRIETVLKRLQIRGNPTLPTSTFPRPVHPLFSQQSEFNESLVLALSLEIKSATELAQSVEALAKRYRTSYEAVNRVEDLSQATVSLNKTFTSVIDRLENGAPSKEGDGTPPTLMSSECLDPTCHSVFLALLPSLAEELAAADYTASDLLRQLPVALLHLDFPGVDQEFKSNASAQLSRLKQLRERGQRLLDEVLRRTDRLRESRRLWIAMDSLLKDLESIRREAVDEMESCRWRQSSIRVTGAPPTPESPPSFPLPDHSLQQDTELDSQLGHLGEKMEKLVEIPLASLSTSLEVPLKDYLSQGSQNLKSHFARVRRMLDLLKSLHNQTSVMASIHEEFNALQLRIDDIMIRYDTKIENTLTGTRPENAELEMDEDEIVSNDYASTRYEAMAFVNGLFHRVPLVTSTSKVPFIKRSFSSVNITLVTPPAGLPIELPFDPRAVDDSVRSDCNSYAMRLSGQVRSLEQKLDHYRLSQIAQELDTSTSVLLSDMEHAVRQVTDFQQSLKVTTAKSDILQYLVQLEADVTEAALTDRSMLSRSLSLIYEIQGRLESDPAAHDSGIHDRLLLPRIRTVSRLEADFAFWESSIDVLRSQIAAARESETVRLQQEREVEDARLAAEREKLVQEEAERAHTKKERLEEEERRKAEKARLAEEERLRQEEEERLRVEAERQEEAERVRLQEMRFAEEACVRAEQEKLALEEAEKARLEKERLEMALKLKETEEKLLVERQLHAERERLALEKAERAQREREKLDEERNQAVKELEAANISLEEDVFGLRISPAAGLSMTQEIKDVLAVMARLRKRLRSIGINGIARRQSNNSDLPGADQAQVMRQQLVTIKQEVGALPDSVEVVSVNVQLQSLRSDIDASFSLMDHVDRLATLCEAISTCDGTLSDLLEHIDSYPAEPLGPLSSSYKGRPNSMPEKQLLDRLTFTSITIKTMTKAFEAVEEDPRAHVENERVLQTWSELEEMAQDRISGKKSRPSSVMSTQSSGQSRRSSSAIKAEPPLQPQPRSNAKATRKSISYASLSVSSTTPRSRLNIPSPTPTHSRRAFSGSEENYNGRPTSSAGRMSSLSTRHPQRATSGGNLYGSTFASRQRTTSLTTGTPQQKRNVSAEHSRSQTATVFQNRLEPSPNVSDASVSHGRSSWSRAPRISFVGVPRMSTPTKRLAAPRKTYVANPKSKLDVAVGDVVNSLPVGINVEGVSGSWKDQSGKYWIGDQDPKLCFCRILRSQTVMVRVGGGWSELSRFIRDHFADSFRMLTSSDSPGMHATGGGEERWISVATLLEERNTPPGPPKTPEPRGPSDLPSFALSTPSGHSPQSLLSTPSTKGSPLTPLQFMRRAEPEVPFLSRPETPTKTPHRTRMNPVHTPARHSIWRP